MYMEFFGFRKAPFRITPDPAFFFSGGNRGAVLEALIYAIARGEGMVKVVGEVGSGKTMLCRMLERELPNDCEIVYLANPRLSADEILHAIAVELGIDIAAGASKLEVMRRLHGYLLDKHAHNRHVVMFIEEAQAMARETLEEIRLLSNLETTQDKLLQIVLFGQPELDERLRAHDIRQLKERITYAFDLKPLTRAEIRDYLTTRVRASGFRGNDLFSRGAIRVLTRSSRGLLRRINILADKALLAAFAHGRRQVTAKHVRMAAAEAEFTQRRFTLVPGFVLAGALGVAVLAGGAWWFGGAAMLRDGTLGELFMLDLTKSWASDAPAAANDPAGTVSQDDARIAAFISAPAASAPSSAGFIDHAPRVPASPFGETVSN